MNTHKNRKPMFSVWSVPWVIPRRKDKPVELRDAGLRGYELGSRGVELKHLKEVLSVVQLRLDGQPVRRFHV
jgi:hypothetical protein